MAVGGYPIPPPSTEDIDHLFTEDPNGTRPRPEGSQFTALDNLFSNS